MAPGPILGGTRRSAAVAAAGVLVTVLAAIVALSPVAGALCVPVLLGIATGAMHRDVTRRIAARVLAALTLAALVVLTAIAPAAALLAVAGICAAAVLVSYRRPLLAAARFAARVAAPPVVAALCVALALAVALYPGTAALAAAGAAALAIAWGARRGLGRLAAGTLRPAVALVAAGAVCGIAFALALAPASALVAAVVLGIAVLATRSPALALGAAVLLFSFEGSVKILLGMDGVALPGGNRAAGAAVLDVGLLAAIAGVLVSDGLRTPRALWAAATRPERAAIAVIGAWLALSVVQIAQGGDVSRGLHGFRLFQWYTLVVLASLIVFAEPRLRSGALRGVLVISLIVSAYAALRVAIGPADAERAFATAVPTVTMYGDTLRAIGSFSSAIGLSSFLTPVVVFSLALGLLLPRLRVLSWAVAGLGLVGLIGSYSRASLFGVALGLGCAIVLVFVVSDMSARRKLVSAGLVVAMVAATYGGLWAASRTSPELRDRAEGVLNPLGDESVKLRFETWERNLEDAADHPLGQGVGAVGAASSPTRPQIRTTDNSFLKVLVEQGVLGLVLFAGGMLAAVVLLARRLRVATPAALQPIGLAALAGFAAFLGTSFAGETVEQPGKVMAWGLLGMAAACAFAGATRESEVA